MFPWVNRIVESPYAKIAQYQFADGKGYPLHGLYANTKREVKVQEKLNENSPQIQIKISDALKVPTIHGFEEIFTLGENWI